MKPIQFSHANGFPAEAYKTFFQQLEPYTVHAVPAFGLGPYKVEENWYPLTQELIAHIEAHGQYPVIGVGHSLGGMLTLWAATQRPDLFSQIILMDPPFLGRLRRVGLGFARTFGFLYKLDTIVRRASRRKDVFKSKQEAYDYWKEKSLFRNFDSRSFQDYVDAIMVPDGHDQWTLKIPKELEASIFAHIPARLKHQPLGIPSHYLVPERTVLSKAEQREIKRKFHSFEFIKAKGGHLFPMEHPEITAAQLKELIVS